MDSYELTNEVIGAAIEVHKTLGPGLLESIYERCLCHELSLRGIEYVQQLEIPLTYKGMSLDSCYRLDMMVVDQIVVEVKSIKTFEPIHTAQILTYLRLTGKRLGLLMNFNSPVLSKTIKRVIL
ncbi:MAG TPA: GxxExxY protein [Candidatus Ozemobacteraceae bacterium]